MSTMMINYYWWYTRLYQILLYYHVIINISILSHASTTSSFSTYQTNAFAFYSSSSSSSSSKNRNLNKKVTTIRSLSSIQLLSKSTLDNITNPSGRHFTRSSSSLYSARELHTAYEWLSRQRGPLYSKYITWFDPFSNSHHHEDNNNKTPISNTRINIDRKDVRNDENYIPSLVLPIFPLPSVYIPSSTTIHSINSIQAKNINMAQDLDSGLWNLTFEDLFQNQSTNLPKNEMNNILHDMKQPNSTQKNESFFITTLCAQDTSRISRIGTLMKVQSIQPQYSYDKKTLFKIVIQCQACGIVYIHDASLKNNDSNQYFVGRVQILETLQLTSLLPSETTKLPTNDIYKYEGMNNDYYDDIHLTIDSIKSQKRKSIIQSIFDNYTKVRSMYINPMTNNNITMTDLPTFFNPNHPSYSYYHNELQRIFPSPHEFISPLVKLAIHTNNNSLLLLEQEENLERFWTMVENWQVLCYTIREYKKSMLLMNINELMIDAASKKGGMLSLPIKLKDLPTNVQSEVYRMEQDCNEDYLNCGMEPVLHFQVLLSLASLNLNEALHDETQAIDSTEKKGIYAEEDVYWARIKHFGDMIQMERIRLETKQKLYNIFTNS